MATIKVACPKCGQKVSGDESFHGTTVECPICSSDIRFPGEKRLPQPPASITPVPPDPKPEAPPEAKSEPRSEATHDLRPDAVRSRFPADEAGFSPPGSPPVPVPPENSAPGVRSDPVNDSPPPMSPTRRPADGTGQEDIDDLPPSPIWGAISIVSAVLSIVTCIGGILFAPLAIIFGHTALAKARHSPIQPAPGHTLGAIGLMIGYVSLVLLILVLLLALLFQGTLREFFQGIQN